MDVALAVAVEEIAKCKRMNLLSSTRVTLSCSSLMVSPTDATKLQEASTLNRISSMRLSAALVRLIVVAFPDFNAWIAARTALSWHFCSWAPAQCSGSMPDKLPSPWSINIYPLIPLVAAFPNAKAEERAKFPLKVFLTWSWNLDLWERSPTLLALNSKIFGCTHTYSTYAFLTAFLRCSNQWQNRKPSLGPRKCMRRSQRTGNIRLLPTFLQPPSQGSAHYPQQFLAEWMLENSKSSQPREPSRCALTEINKIKTDVGISLESTPRARAVAFKYAKRDTPDLKKAPIDVNWTLIIIKLTCRKVAVLIYQICRISHASAATQG